MKAENKEVWIKFPVERMALDPEPLNLQVGR